MAAISPAQQARNNYAGAIRAKRPPEVLDQAREAIEVAKAEQAIASWSTLSLIQRARLAAKLLAGEDALAT